MPFYKKKKNPYFMSAVLSLIINSLLFEDFFFVPCVVSQSSSSPPSPSFLYLSSFLRKERRGQEKGEREKDWFKCRLHENLVQSPQQVD